MTNTPSSDKPGTKGLSTTPSPGGTSAPQPDWTTEKIRLGRLARRMNIQQWIARERAEYADKKYDRDGEVWHRLLLDMANFGLAEEGEWWGFITNYLKRAQLLGLDNPSGRQALGKLIVTLLSCMDAAIEVSGDLPRPGVPSGQIEMWARGRE